MFKDVWFVTGASTGLGKALVKYLLTQNCKVVATSRNPENIKNLKSMSGHQPGDPSKAAKVI